MAADAGGRPLAHDVDEVRWLGIDEAVAMVTYDRDREVLERARPFSDLGEPPGLFSGAGANIALCEKSRERPLSNPAKCANFPLAHPGRGL